MPNRSVHMGSLLTDTPSEVFCLAARTSNAPKFDTLKKDGVPYVVTPVKTLYICKVSCSPAPVNLVIEIGHATATVADGLSPTGYVKSWGISLTGVAYQNNERNVWIPIPTGKYPTFQSVDAGGATISVQCVEL